MDARNGLLALAAVILAGVITLWAGLFALSKHGPQTTLEQQLAFETGPAASSAPQLAVANVRTVPPAADPGLRVRWLQQELDARTEQLTRQNDLLKENVAAQQKLRQDYEELAKSVLQDGAEERDAASDLELHRLNEELMQAQLEGSRAAAVRDQLEQRLQAAERRLSELREAAEQEIVDLVAIHQARQSAANEALVRLGVEAVPLLVESLKSSRPEVREWAAAVLGQIGPEAEDALRALSESQADNDPRVRSAVARAIAAIDR